MITNYFLFIQQMSKLSIAQQPNKLCQTPMLNKTQKEPCYMCATKENPAGLAKDAHTMPSLEASKR